MLRLPCQRAYNVWFVLDLGAAGVMFTIDTESAFEDVVFITSSYGLGETVVQRIRMNYVHKPMLEQGKLPVIRRNIGSNRSKWNLPAKQSRPLGQDCRCSCRVAQSLLVERY